MGEGHVLGHHAARGAGGFHRILTLGDLVRRLGNGALGLGESPGVREIGDSLACSLAPDDVLPGPLGDLPDDVCAHVRIDEVGKEFSALLVDLGVGHRIGLGVEPGDAGVGRRLGDGVEQRVSHHAAVVRRGREVAHVPHVRAPGLGRGGACVGALIRVGGQQVHARIPHLGAGGSQVRPHAGETLVGIRRDLGAGGRGLLVGLHLVVDRLRRVYEGAEILQSQSGDGFGRLVEALAEVRGNFAGLSRQPGLRERLLPLLKNLDRRVLGKRVDRGSQGNGSPE